MTTVAVTGSNGLIGSAVVKALLAAPQVEEVVAIDLDPPAQPTGATFRRGDITDRQAMLDALAGVDVVVHLAARFDTGKDVERIRQVNVDGAKLVAEVARDLGARKVIVPSSASAYGAHPDNELPLPEEHPLRANPGLPYAEHKREIDLWLQRWSEDQEHLVVTVLRPAIVTGAGADNFAVRGLLLPRIPVVAGHRPPYQFVHLDDVTSAIVHVVNNDLPGVFNVASEGWLSYEEVAAILRRRFVDVPEEVAFSATDQLYRLGLGDLPPAVVHYVMHPWVMSVDKLIATGWRPQHSNRDALAAFVRAHGDEIIAGPVRTTRAQARGAVLAGIGALVSLAGLGLLRRRRRRR